MALPKSMAFPRAFWLLWCGQIVSRLGTLAPAFLVLYLEQGDLVTDKTIPLIVGLFGAGVLVSGLVGGAVADAVGGRRTIVAAQPVAAATALLFLFAHNLYALCGLALATGFLSAVDRPASAGLISKIVPRKDFSRAYSLHMIGFNVGMSLSPVLAGFLLALHPPLLFLVWAVSAVAYAVLVGQLPKEPKAGDSSAGTGGFGLRVAVRGVSEPFRSPALVAFLILTFVLAAIYLQVNSALPLDMRGKGLDPGQIGIVLAINAVLAIAILGLVPRLVKNMQDHTPLFLASVLFAVGFGLNALALDMGMFILATVVWTLGETLWAPMSATFIAKRAPAGKVSTYQGSYFFAWNAAFVVGGPLGLTIANAYGFAALWLATLVLGLGAAVVFLFIRFLPGYVVTPSGPAEVDEHASAPSRETDHETGASRPLGTTPDS
ncbi:hypothetical protein N566_25250 [Streptomycetaceae bacterium MP113-05]|nr:hypothetical protein N566_25250 [Streptomycetaceae bacterium MP113-05]